MKRLTSHIYNAILNIRHRLAEEWRVKYRIIELNHKKKEVVLNVKRRSLVLKYNITDAIKENWIIEAISTEDAALLGYFYGRCYRLVQGNDKSKITPSPFTLKTACAATKFYIVIEMATSLIPTIETTNCSKKTLKLFCKTHTLFLILIPHKLVTLAFLLG